jgi:cytochrome oxidase Cu insertion factor (SCO1/SenC/PrrC family)
MSFSVSARAPIPAAERRRARWIALGLFVFAALPVVAAFVAYFFWTPKSGVNYGELIEPRPSPEAPLTAPDGSTWRLSSLRGSWVLVQIGSGLCEEPCVKRLFAMRQSRLLQGREMGRVERVWVITDDARPDPELLQAYDGTRIARDTGGIGRQFPAERPADHIFLVDPLGNVMLRFPADPDPLGMSRDLARLLRVSHVG